MLTKIQRVVIPVAMFAEAVVQSVFHAVGTALHGPAAAQQHAEAYDAAAAQAVVTRARAEATAAKAEADADACELAAIHAENNRVIRPQFRVEFPSFTQAARERAQAIVTNRQHVMPEGIALSARQVAWPQSMTGEEAGLIYCGQVSDDGLARFAKGQKEIKHFRPVKSVDPALVAAAQDQKDALADEMRVPVTKWTR